MKCQMPSCQETCTYSLTTLDLNNDEKITYYCTACAELVNNKLTMDTLKYKSIRPLSQLKDILDDLESLQRDVSLRVEDIKRKLQNMV